MDAKTKSGLIASGAIIGLLGILYLIFKKPPTSVTNVFGGDGGLGGNSDPYSLVDKAEKIQTIKDYLKKQSGYDESNQTNIDMQKLYAAKGMVWQPYWNQSDTYAKQTNNGINAWYFAIMNNQPTFTFYVDDFFKKYKVNTKDGSWTGEV
jgi:hypothetical protein